MGKRKKRKKETLLFKKNIYTIKGIANAPRGALAIPLMVLLPVFRSLLIRSSGY